MLLPTVKVDPFAYRGIGLKTTGLMHRPSFGRTSVSAPPRLLIVLIGPQKGNGITCFRWIESGDLGTWCLLGGLN